ncbi:acyl-CoA dehydrogenase family protein [Streptomyces sp. MZ04]|uniref:acyl-CoA dehydrogenase family protein n=1 Tax=Streptomyces sp. MZ04 TaxID=2559236 RepID=UPI00107EDC9F|nr:acyl-CoA dehydrogenase family protein [Streptomyces sp. MZ04]TGA89254.1 acyl-CoA dehydrogenase [Streptomyces sp. MZ04]
MRESAEQAELRAAVRSVLDRHEGGAAWAPLTGQIGVAGLYVPEEYGGLGCGAPEVHVVMEELGRALSPVPYLGSAVLAVVSLIASGDAGACAELLPGLAEGRVTGALGWAEGGGWDASDVEASASRDAAGGWRLSGVKEHVLAGGGPGAVEPGVLLAFARTSRGLGLFQLEADSAELMYVPTMDGTRPQARMVLRGAPARLVGADGSGERILARVRDVACVALAAEQVGGAGRALDDTVRYAKDRVQFGRPIGSFQAVKHRLADMYVQVEAARSIALAAAYADARTDLAAAAKSACSEAYAAVAAEMIQLHGGIGITWEHEAHRHFKRAHGAGLLFGSPAAHRRRLADALTLLTG